MVLYLLKYQQLTDYAQYSSQNFYYAKFVNQLFYSSSHYLPNTTITRYTNLNMKDRNHALTFSTLIISLYFFHFLFILHHQCLSSFVCPPHFTSTNLSIFYPTNNKGLPSIKHSHLFQFFFKLSILIKTTCTYTLMVLNRYVLAKHKTLTAQNSLNNLQTLIID